MSTFDVLLDKLPTLGVAVYPGYAATGAPLPYNVVRPLYQDSVDVSVGGPALTWDDQFAVYCCASSVVTSHKLAMAVMDALEGLHIEGHYLSTSLGYVGAATEGKYETLVTTQRTKGKINE